MFCYPLIFSNILCVMANKKNEKSGSNYVRSELDFLSVMKPNEPIIAIISENDEHRLKAVEWLSQKLKQDGFVTGISVERHSSEFFKKVDPDILIGDSLKDLSILMNEKPLELIGNGGYIYFKKSAGNSELKKWLQKENRGQHLVEVWVSLSNN